MQINEFLKKHFKYFTFLASVTFWILLIFAFEKPREGALTVLSALIHESGHFLYSLLVLNEWRLPMGRLNGLKMKKSHVISYGHELCLYLSGPVANLFATAAALPFSAAKGGFAREFIVINLLTMFSNLLPVEGYDGYGVLMTLASAHNAEGVARRVLRCVSFGFTALLSLLSLYFMYYLNSGYWIYVIFTVSLLSFMKKALKTQKSSFREI